MAFTKLRTQIFGQENVDAHHGASPDVDMRHIHSIHALAEEVDLPVHEVAAAYEDVLDELQEQARITDYLPILVSKRVKRFYRNHE